MPVYRLNCFSESFFESMYFIRRLCTNAKKIRVQKSIKKVLVFWFMKEIYLPIIQTCLNYSYFDYSNPKFYVGYNVGQKHR